VVVIPFGPASVRNIVLVGVNKSMTQAKVLDLAQYRADQLVEDGKYKVSQGDLDTAIDLFERSIKLKPTADGYTYLAWILSLKGKTDRAMELCRKAIELDPEFGNPLNDLGSYLIQKDRLEEAIPWLEKAKAAKRYEARHFPYINLGRIYSAQGKIDEAISEFKSALDLSPGHQEIQNVLVQLENLKESGK
jgi:Tfp pilus assembly protein PilF